MKHTRTELKLNKKEKIVLIDDGVDRFFFISDESHHICVALNNKNTKKLMTMLDKSLLGRL